MHNSITIKLIVDINSLFKFNNLNTNDTISLIDYRLANLGKLLDTTTTTTDVIKIEFLHLSKIDGYPMFRIYVDDFDGGKSIKEIIQNSIFTEINYNPRKDRVEIDVQLIQNIADHQYNGMQDDIQDVLKIPIDNIFGDKIQKYK